jgi:NAD(P)-dependent dehydrogenase (short-subunit alcohol dehydrogenase family)
MGARGRPGTPPRRETRLCDRCRHSAQWGLPGIGEAIAVLFARQGVKVAIADVSAERARATLHLVNDVGGDGVVVVGDLSRETDNARCVEEAVNAFGGLDTVVNNVALSGGGGSPADVDLEVWERVIAVNLGATMLTARHTIPHLKLAGGGSIINMSADYRSGRPDGELGASMPPSTSSTSPVT